MGAIIILSVLIIASIVIVTDISIRSENQIRGTVQLDETEIEGAKIEAWNGTDKVATTTTNQNGEYKLNGLDDFEGDIVVSVEGFESSTTEILYIQEIQIRIMILLISNLTLRII